MLGLNGMGRSQRRAAAVGRRLGVTPLAMAAALLLGMAGTATLAADAAPWAAGRLLVLPRAGMSDAALAKVLEAHGGQARRIGNSDLRIVDLPGGVSESAVLLALQNHPHLKFVELDRRVQSTLVPNDPYNGSEWHLPKINAGTAWDVARGAGITIAVIDSGVMGTHADLLPNLVAGWNFVDSNSSTGDVNGHGTAVAGTAAAVVNNGVGVAGVAGQAKIMPLRVSDASGSAYYSAIASAVTYAADHGARVANASFASLYASPSVQSAAQYLKGKGGLLVVSAGNSGANDGASATTAMIPVSATDGNDVLASWSSFGNYVAVAAPGVGIYTTNWDGGYASWSGTSFSSPVTAGLVALMMAANPTLSSSQVESLLYSTAVDLGAAGRDVYFGYGRVNASAAVQAAAAATGADTVAPTVAITAPVGGGATVSGLVAVDASALDNVGVTKVELRVNGSSVATDTGAPYQFSWDSTKVANGSASLVAYAFDAAGNSAGSSAVTVTVANPVLADTTAPVVTITNPSSGKKVTNVVQVGVSASDNSGAAGIKQTLYIDGTLVASATGASLSYTWNARSAASGQHTISAVAKDAAGNTTTKTVQVNK